MWRGAGGDTTCTYDGVDYDALKAPIEADPAVKLLGAGIEKSWMRPAQIPSQLFLKCL